MKITDALVSYESHLREGGITFSVVRQKRYSMIHFIDFLRSRNVHRLEGVTRALVEEYKVHLLGQKVLLTGKRLRSKTVVLYLEGVKRFFLYAMERGFVSTNPAARIMRGAPLRDGFKSSLTLEEMEKVLSIPDVMTPVGVRDRAILEVIYATGMRLWEVSRLEISDVNLVEGLLHVRAYPGRGGRERMVPLAGQAREWLDRYLKEVRPVWRAHSEERRVNFRRLSVARAVRHEEAVFLGPLCGETMSDREVGDFVGTSVRAVKPSVIHAGRAIRHACAQRHLAGGATLEEVHKILDHSRMTDTEMYVRTAPGEEG